MSFLDFLTFTKGKKEENKQMELTEDEVIEMLKVSPDRFHEFENYYKTKILPNAESSGDFFDVNSRQAAVLSKGDIDISVEDTINRIVKELLSDTEKIVYDGNSQYHAVHSLMILSTQSHLTRFNKSQET